MSLAAAAFQLGLERLLHDPPAWIEGARLGLLINQASVDAELRYACDVLAERFPGQLKKLFSPQHGLWGEQQANMVESPHTWHERRKVPVFSLYAESREPTPEMLADLDCLLIDLQDVGTRVYTFAWTALACLRACAAVRLQVVVLDRPNPLGGQQAEGPRLLPDYRSFVGGATIPMRHGLTLGELLQYLNEQLQIGADLHVIPMQAWQRGQQFEHFQRAWIPPSPNLPDLASTRVYPGQVLLEGTHLSEGRGTTLPFQWCGAPYVDPERLVEAVKSFDLPGVRLRPIRFVPTFDKWQGQSCGGLAIHITDPIAFRSYRTTLAVLVATYRLWPDAFRWLDPPYEYETQKMPIDILSGSSQLREQLSSVQLGDDAQLKQLGELDEGAWWDEVAPHLLY